MSPLLLFLGTLISVGLATAGYYFRRRTDDLDWQRYRRGLARNWITLFALGTLAGLLGTAEDLGLRLQAVETFIDGTLFGFIAFAGTMLLVGLVFRFVDDLTLDRGSLVVIKQPRYRRLGVALTGATVESIVFYGFVLEAILSRTGEPWLAGIGATAGLLVARGRWGYRNVIQWLPGALVLAGIALWARTVIVIVAIRFVYDSVTLLSADTSDYAVAGDS
ncbi:MAG: hypothetical protein ACI9PP_000753 [Halobacteriales archaeon]|jgi:hypothetical protein